MLNELYDRYKNNPRVENLKDLLNWLYENSNSINLNEQHWVNACEVATRYLFNVKIGNWNDVEAKFIITFLSKQCAKEFGLYENLSISILDEPEYELRHGNSNAICINNGNQTFDLVYSSKVMLNLQSDNIHKFMRGLQTLFHEVVHAFQNSVIERNSIGDLRLEEEYTYKMYITALETIVKKVDKNFYEKNYSKLYKENHAEKIGLIRAVDTIKKYNDRLYLFVDEDHIQRRIDEYDKKLDFNSSLILNDIEYTKVIEIFDAYCSKFISHNLEYLDKYPILKLAYNQDGTKKNIIQLFEQRMLKLEQGYNKAKTDELYTFIANRKNFMAGGLKGTKSEIEDLVNYIKVHEIEDEFLYSLLEHRLKKANWDVEKINSFFKLLNPNYDNKNQHSGGKLK